MLHVLINLYCSYFIYIDKVIKDFFIMNPIAEKYKFTYDINRYQDFFNKERNTSLGVRQA